MSENLAQVASTAAAAGVALHLGYFIRGDHILETANFAVSGLVVPPILTILLALIGHSFLETLLTVTVGSLSLITGVYSSIAAYRLFFHSCRQFPGPLGAKLTKLWHARIYAKGTPHHKLFDDLHQQYGDWVRVGPNEISVIDPEIVEAVNSARSKCFKTEFYDRNLPTTTLQQMRDRNLHDRRRKAGWDQAFSVKALRSYDATVVDLADKLIKQIDASKGKAMNASIWFANYSYEVMSILGFGQQTHVLDTGKQHFAQSIIAVGASRYSVFLPIPWFMKIMYSLPASWGAGTRLFEYSQDCVKTRKENKSIDNDILGHLIEHENFFDGRPDLNAKLLIGDARLVMIAGTDTTSSALTYCFAELVHNQELVRNIRKELSDHNITDNADSLVIDLQHLDYLNGFIQEVLRLWPPVMAGVYRQTPPEGLMVGERFIPGNVHITIPHYSLQRSPKSFVEPNKLIPERWTSRPDLVLHKQAYMPFMIGPYSCVGKQLALNELRTVIVKILLRFDIALADGDDGTAVYTKLKDHFTSTPGPLNLCFTPRQAA